MKSLINNNNNKIKMEEDINKIFKDFSKHYKNEALKHKKESVKYLVFSIAGTLGLIIFLYSMMMC
jgi:hypothetical protein